MGPITRILIAVQFLTSIPINIRRPFGPEDAARAMAFFPLVGAALGAVLVGVDWAVGAVSAGASTGASTGMPAAAAVLLASAILTRCLHIDGLADTAEGLFGGSSRERALEIMRDSRVGSFGVVAIVAFYLLKFALLAQFSLPARWAGLLLTPTLGRLAMVWAAFIYPYARKDGPGKGLGKSYTEFVGRTEVILASATALVISALVVGVMRLSCLRVGGLILATSLVSGLSARFVAGRLGGMTGDTFGALNEVTEVAALFFAQFM